MLTEKIWLAKDYLSGDNPARLGILRGDLTPVMFYKKDGSEYTSIINLMHTKYARSWKLQSIKHDQVIPIKEGIDIDISSRGRKGSWDDSLKLLEKNDIVVVNFPQYNVFKNAVSDLKNVIKRYKHCTVIGHKMSPSKKRSDLILTVAMYRLGMVCPIYNLDKTDGIGLSIMMLDKSKTKSSNLPVVVFAEDVLLSNHADNVLRIDGAEIREEVPSNISMIVDTLNNMIRKGGKNSDRNEGSNWAPPTSISFEMKTGKGSYGKKVGKKNSYKNAYGDVVKGISDNDYAAAVKSMEDCMDVHVGINSDKVMKNMKEYITVEADVIEPGRKTGSKKAKIAKHNQMFNAPNINMDSNGMGISISGSDINDVQRTGKSMWVDVEQIQTAQYVSGSTAPDDD